MRYRQGLRASGRERNIQRDTERERQRALRDTEKEREREKGEEWRERRVRVYIHVRFSLLFLRSVLHCTRTAHALHTHCTAQHSTAHALHTHFTRTAHALHTHCTCVAFPPHIPLVSPPRSCTCGRRTAPSTRSARFACASCATEIIEITKYTHTQNMHTIYIYAYTRKTQNQTQKIRT